MLRALYVLSKERLCIRVHFPVLWFFKPPGGSSGAVAKLTRSRQTQTVHRVFFRAAQSYIISDGGGKQTVAAAAAAAAEDAANRYGTEAAIIKEKTTLNPIISALTGTRNYSTFVFIQTLTNHPLPVAEKLRKQFAEYKQSF